MRSSTAARFTFASLVFALATVPSLACEDSAEETARACSIAAPSADDWHLRAEGTLLKDSNGRVISLRGVNAGGRSKFAPYAPFDFAEGGYDAALAAYLDRAKSWGINVLRVPFSWAAIEPTEGQDDEAFLKRYDALLDGAWARGMWTIVDFHQDIYAEAFCGDGFPAWTLPQPAGPPQHDCKDWGQKYLNDKDVQAAFARFWAAGSPVRAAFEKMWTRMLARHKDRPGVIGFEPMNEPGWGAGTVDTFEQTTLGDFYDAMLPFFQTAAPKALVFVDPIGVTSVGLATKLRRPKGEGFVFAPHYYDILALGGGRGTPDLVEKQLAHWSTLGAEWKVPTLVGEFGVAEKSENAVEFLAAHWAAFDKLGLHATQWEYSASRDVWNEERLGLVSPDGTELPMAGPITRPQVRAIAGSEVAPPAFDGPTKTFTVSYVPSEGGVSEIAIPSKAFPNGRELVLTGGCYDDSAKERLLVRSDPGTKRVELRIKAR